MALGAAAIPLPPPWTPPRPPGPRQDAGGGVVELVDEPELEARGGILGVRRCDVPLHRDGVVPVQPHVATRGPPRTADPRRLLMRKP